MSQLQHVNPEFIEDIKSLKAPSEADNATYQNVERPPKERGEFLKCLAVIQAYEHDWDGNDGVPPHPQAIATAKIFIEKLPWQRKFPCSVYPGSDRSIVFEWSKDDSGKLMLTIEPHYIGAIRISDDGSVRDMGDFTLLPDASVLPKELQEIIARS